MADVDDLMGLIDKAKAARRKSDVMHKAQERASANYRAALAEQTALDKQMYDCINELIK